MRVIARLMTVRTVTHAITLAAMAATAAALATWMPIWWIGILLAVVVDGAWWTAARYEARIRETGASSALVTRLTWGIAGLSAALLITHAVAERSVAWGAVAVLPIVSRTLAWIDALWEATELTSDALSEIRQERQQARDEAAVARARLMARAAAEEVRVAAVTSVGVRVAGARVDAATRLSEAGAALDGVRRSDAAARALAAVPDGWDVPVLGEYSPVSMIASQGSDLRGVAAPHSRHAIATPVSDGPLDAVDLDAILAGLRDSTSPPMSFRRAAAAFRAAGHRASDTELRAAWHRIAAEGVTTGLRPDSR